MNLFRKERPLPKNLIEVNDRLAELRYGNRLRQDSEHGARRINELVRTVDRLAGLVTEAARRSSSGMAVARARQFKVLEVITDIDLADPRADGGGRACDRIRSSPAASATFPPLRSSAATIPATSSRS